MAVLKRIIRINSLKRLLSAKRGRADSHVVNHSDKKNIDDLFVDKLLIKNYPYLSIF